MQTHVPTNADLSQQTALESGCGIVSWDRSAIVQHSGPDALDLLHRLTTKELLSVPLGQAARTTLASVKGRVVDVFLVAHVSENQLLLISDSSDSERLVSAIDYYTIIEDAELVDLTETHDRISLIGPSARSVVESALDVAVKDDAATITSFASGSVTVISDTSRTVEWFDVIAENGATDQLMQTFETAGAVAVDHDNYELFRIDHEIPGSDHEYGEHANPIEAGLLPLIDWDKGCYVGQEVVARLDAYDKVQRNVKVLKSATPLTDGAKLTSSDKPAGVVTSTSNFATEDGTYLSLALVRVAFIDPGNAIDAEGAPATVR